MFDTLLTNPAIVIIANTGTVTSVPNAVTVDNAAFTYVAVANPPLYDSRAENCVEMSL